MSARSKSLKLGVVVAAVSGLAFSGLAPANADVTPSGGTTLGTTLVGVGSDTTQWVMDKLITDYNSSSPAVAAANYDACLGNTTVGAPGLGDNPDGSGFPCGADHTGTKAGVKRPATDLDPAAPSGAVLPSGSGDGRTLLRTSTDPLFNDVAFGRSSGPINTTDLAAGEKALPFAVDKIVVATNPTGPAPASLSGQQVLKIFNGTYTNWNQVGGKNAPIHPYMPKSGSSTLNAFTSFLAGLDGVNEAPGQDNDAASHAAAYQVWQGPGNVTEANWNTGTTKVEEHDPSVIVNDVNAIEPFSYGRAQLANGAAKSVRIEGGWSADRELYNVVRGAAISGASTTPFLWGSDGGALEALFSPTGWLCTNATATADIADAGFWPLKAGTATGNCGVANNNTTDTINSAASNGVGEGLATTTTAYVANRAVNVIVQASDGSAPTGQVQVVVAPPAVPGNSAPASYSALVSLTNGGATVPLPASVSGSKVVDVSFLPTNFGKNAVDGGHDALGSSYAEFSSNVPPAVTPPAKVATTVKATAKPTRLANATKVSKVTVVVTAAKGVPTGAIKLLNKAGKVIVQGTLAGGKVVLKVKGKKLRKGKNILRVKYLPTGNFTAPTSVPTVKIVRLS